MGRPVLATLAVLFVALALLATPVTGDSASDTVLAQPDGFDRTVFDVTVFANGSATWAFEHHRTLENESQERNFQAFADGFEENETGLYRDFVDQSEILARTGTERTGRTMAARNHARSASIDRLGQTEGVVRMSFLWTGFAAQDDDGVVAADVFEGGLVLGADQRVVFHHGSNLAFASVQPSEYTLSGENLTESQSVTFFGPTQFADRRPRVEYVTVDASGGPMDEGPGTNVAVFALLLVLLLGVVTAIAWHAGLLENATTGTTADTGNDPPATPTEARSDSDRVLELLEDNGGRMKQVRIVEETDWSKSKVSMLLSDMEDDGQITKLRVGRENIVSLAGEEPDAAGSPFGGDE